MIFLALVDGKPREMDIKQLLREFVRHRVQVIRRRTQFLLARCRRQKHTVEGLLLALADIDKMSETIRKSKTQAEAKQGLMGIECPAAMMQRALGDEGYEVFKSERGESDECALDAFDGGGFGGVRLACESCASAGVGPETRRDDSGRSCR